LQDGAILYILEVMKKHLLRGFGLLGILVFVPLFLFTFSDPQSVEKVGKGFIEWKLKNTINKKIDAAALPQSKTLKKLLGSKAKMLQKKTDERLAALKQQLKDDVQAMVAAQIAKMADLSCECRQKWEEHLRDSIKFEITSLEKAKAKLTDFIASKYMEIVEKLTKDVRIFLGANALVFIFLFLVSFLKPRATEHLFLPGALMLLSTIVCSYFYLFEQNWFYTILYDDYTGFGYLVYLSVVFAFLCDIVFNKARVTTRIINLLLDSIGSAFTVVPC
jgi:hypothetical protein